ncbi:HNH endonuclease [Fodinibius sediminis]|uniref:Putative restriction endonuclease n=1 Tax=Fodinibius sediminis TaxID=1214077 RepID=A0A521DZ71_9BACT|nr:HNH endonuclease [Fodinibius sediminis]SMO77013.1 putative restriction endonuclease [Fodinibius sediminis]
MDTDKQIRLTTFSWLTEQVEMHGDVLNRNKLAKGFYFKGTRIPLVSPQGIFKPKQLDLPLTITTSPKGPYTDSFDKNDFLLYKYRGTDPMHRDNVGLRQCMQNETPLIYFHGIVPGKYLAVWPVYVIGDNPDALTFRVAADNQYEIDSEGKAAEGSQYRRAYITSTVKRRLHQRGFRERVMAAYQSQCAFCQLKHVELLDAAHIIPDKDEESIPSVNNGLALCKIHHAAFDQHIIGVSPDYEIKVKEDVLQEKDGPMLKHGIQELQDQKLILPKSKSAWPNQEFLDVRYQRFKDVG